MILLTFQAKLVAANKAVCWKIITFFYACCDLNVLKPSLNCQCYDFNIRQIVIIYSVCRSGHGSAAAVFHWPTRIIISIKESFAVNELMATFNLYILPQVHFNTSSLGQYIWCLYISSIYREIKVMLISKHHEPSYHINRNWWNRCF